MEWLVSLFNIIISFAYSSLLSIPRMFKDLFFWIVEQFLGFAEWLGNLILSLFAPIDVSQYLTSIPPNVSWVFMQLGLPNCLFIIGTAIVIRLTLQLIPFTRFGS
uniref:DUF2523 domain-containing protein n=1 Tax=Aliivibrio wodanis TaxID=80852 RepID=A0A5Q4ZP53_9GAMM|nr:hypothetical protein AW0309160_01497 [Aliivibrio wodanis]VVV04124.1 hypothetical protein AW0309160_01507 [Aliivibrio wodanis]VVV04134.1 hypothetical protein AW0309160_01517 [Aliivibrio wodanis]